MWQKETSATRQKEIDFTSSPNFVVERRNIVGKSIEVDGENVIQFESEVRFVPFNEYLSNIKILEEENAKLVFQGIEKDAKIEFLENEQANLIFTLLERGVI